ncbi:tetratricopeptide repeat protein [Fodinibius halophilus]|uniref:Tetratricopeptide repeat protein n=1 Tax=Fodinibius halophilus TaxID=1736908 RepID=A0A6M1TBT3_9BACT|nr:tetratricopeptide repeat protein [Fodinibius halophilus]NGP88384.1 tetratricopeptide repeat protein [Fodinibius halophilus]
MIESYNEKQLEEKIDKYVNGQLSPRETDELWAELIQDGYHLDYMKSVANVKAVIQRKKKERQQQKRRKQWFYAAAAAIIFLVGIVGYMNLYNQDNARSLQPISSIELDYYRSTDGSVTEDPKIIRNAIQLANTGAVEEAINLLNNELQQASKPAWIAELSLNLGSLYYNEGDYKESVNHYQRVVEHKKNVDVLMLEKAYWYMGNAYFHMDKLVKARIHIEKAYDLNGAYRRVSKSYLDALSD